MSLSQDFKEMMKEFSIRPNTDIGQNFLFDEEVLLFMVESASLSREDFVLEIGPGPGLLTYLMAQRAGKVLALEVDPKFKPLWERTILRLSNVEIAIVDACRADMRRIQGEALSLSLRLKVVSNLPYHISTPILWKMLEELDRCELFLLMVQEEFARRLSAKPGDKDRSPLGVTAELIGELRLLRKVPPVAFIPPPSVSSRLLALRPRQPRELDLGEARALLKVAFAERRKKLINALGQMWDRRKLQEALTRCQIEEGARAEDLDKKSWLCLLRELKTLRQAL